MELFRGQNVVHADGLLQEVREVRADCACNAFQMVSTFQMALWFRYPLCQDSCRLNC
jgi:hypothetical protein